MRYDTFMKEQAPKIKSLISYSAEERKAFREKGMSAEEIDRMERQKNALFRDSREEAIRNRALKDLQDSLGV